MIGAVRSPLVLRHEYPDEMQGMILHCPRCGLNYTHQEAVEVWDREENAATGTWAHISRSGLLTNKTLMRLEKNPSFSRDGVRIKFSCESCTAPFWVCIAQHKGETFIYAQIEKLIKQR